MKKALMWIRLALYLPAVWLSAIQSRKQDFEVRFQILRHWAKLVVKKANVRLSVEGIEQVPTNETLYYVCNHQGSLDPFILVATVPTSTTAVSKVENRKIPIIGTWMRNVDVIFLDRENMRSALQMVKETAATLKSGRNVVIFPEGTRSKCEKMGEFKSGSIKPAFLSQATIIPCTLINTFTIDVKEIKDNRAKVIFGAPIRYDEYKDLSTVELSNKIQSIIQTNLDRGL